MKDGQVVTAVAVGLGYLALRGSSRLVIPRLTSPGPVRLTGIRASPSRISRSAPEPVSAFEVSLTNYSQLPRQVQIDLLLGYYNLTGFANVTSEPAFGLVYQTSLALPARARGQARLLVVLGGFVPPRKYAAQATAIVDGQVSSYAILRDALEVVV